MGWTYTTLTQAIIDYVQNSETTFTTNIPNFIKSAEDRVFYEADLQAFRRNVTGATSTSNKFLVCPSDYMSSFSLSITSSGSQIFLLQKDAEYLQQYNPSGVQGVPKYYAVFDDATFLLAPIPDDTYSEELHYYYRPDSITVASSGTTWLGDNAQDVLLYGSLVEAYTFMKGETDLLALYNQRFVEALTRLKNYGEGREETDAYRDGLIRVKAS